MRATFNFRQYCCAGVCDGVPSNAELQLKIAVIMKARIGNNYFIFNYKNEIHPYPQYLFCHKMYKTLKEINLFPDNISQHCFGIFNVTTETSTSDSYLDLLFSVTDRTFQPSCMTSVTTSIFVSQTSITFVAIYPSRQLMVFISRNL